MTTNPTGLRPAEALAHPGPMSLLLRAGWSVAEMGAVDADGRAVSTVRGSRGAHTIRADGPSPGEAWANALEQARSLGLDGKPSRG